MANLIEYIQSQVYENSTEDISGSIMQQVLTRMASDEGVVNVHTISGQTPFADYNNAQAARDAVPAGFKKLGLIITYKLSSGWYIDEFIGSATSGWSTASNWKCLGPISVSQNASTGKTTITIGSESFDVATQPVSVSQNTLTTDNKAKAINVGGTDYNITDQDAQDKISQLGQEVDGKNIDISGNGSQEFTDVDLLKYGNVIAFLLVSTSGSGITVYGYYGDNQDEEIVSLSEDNLVSVTLNRDYTKLYFYQPTAGAYELAITQKGLKTQVSEQKAEIDSIELELYGKRATISGNGSQWFEDASYLKNGSRLNFNVESNAGSAIQVYGRSGSQDILIVTLPTVGQKVVTLSGDYSALYLYQATAGAYQITIELVKVETSILNLEERADNLEEDIYGETATINGNGSQEFTNDKLLVSGNELFFKLNSNAGGNIIIYGYYGNNQSEIIGELKSVGSVTALTLNKTYTKLYFYQPTAGAYQIVVDLKSVNKEIEYLNNRVSDIEEDLKGVVFNGNGSKEFNTAKYLANGTRLTIELLSNNGGDIFVYAYYSASEYESWGNLKYPITKDLNKNYTRLYFYQPTAGSYTIELGANNIGGELMQLQNVPVVRALILGDSYSENGGRWIKPMIEQLPKGSSYISLAVSGATIRDKYTDRTTYPYTSRPTISSPGNGNVLASQIEKLKRLMAGTDLDEGETQIYATPASYPNVIIIEGGHNDGFDSDEVESTYYDQYSKVVSNVYMKLYDSSQVEVGDCCIKTPIDEVNRTCFAGAYRYLVEELTTLFPNAQIFFTTASMIGRGNTSVAYRRYKTSEQQRKCSVLCSATLIDWARDGEMNLITNYPSGSGTEQDPYVYGKAVVNPAMDTEDCLHPNNRGGVKLGHLSALVIKQKFLPFI